MPAQRAMVAVKFFSHLHSSHFIICGSCDYHNSSLCLANFKFTTIGNFIVMLLFVISPAVTSSHPAVRFCDSCSPSEVCVASSEEFLPTCRRAEDGRDPTGCAGLCLIEEQVCQRLDEDAYR